MESYLEIAKIIVQNTNGQILVLRRSKTDLIRPLTWDYPGGIIEENENSYDAAKRELLEETGILANQDLQFLTSHKNYSKSKLLLEHFYKLHTKENHVIKLSKEHDRFRWIKPERIMKLKVPELYKEIVSSKML